MAARKLLLPHFTLTEVVEADAEGSCAAPGAAEPYHVRPVLRPSDGLRRDGKPKWVKSRFNLFPVILDAGGVLWAEAVVYLLSRMESQLVPNMATYAGIADDLAAYRRFLDDNGIDWTVFPAQKLLRPTYRFNGYLKFAVSAGETSPATAKRRMGSVIGFYRWLVADGALKPAHPPWKDTDRFLEIKDAYGIPHYKKVVTTDLSIWGPKHADPYDGAIQDGGKLRPLTAEEQLWLVDALNALCNTEMTLIHLVAWQTGARMQTVLTIRVGHIVGTTSPGIGDVALKVGPGTGIDTKGNKRMVLHIPSWLHRSLRSYAQSDRALGRRLRAPKGDYPGQYLFLSQRGAPLYQDRASSFDFDEANVLHHSKSGQGVRQFITERVIPHIQTNPGAAAFRYRFHDLRATAGMNWTDQQLRLVQAGEISLHAAREFVKFRMGHESTATTDRYLQFRQHQAMVRWAAHSHEQHLQSLAAKAIDGLE